MPSGRSNFAQTSVAFTAEAGALALLGLVLAYWTWAWLAPSPLPQAMGVSAPGGRLTAAGNLFGQAQGDARTGTPTGLAIELLGVVAGVPAGSGYALLRLDAKETRVVRAGEELAAGIRVESVLPEQVVLQRNGARETLTWPRPLPAPAVPANRAVR